MLWSIHAHHGFRPWHLRVIGLEHSGVNALLAASNSLHQSLGCEPAVGLLHALLFPLLLRRDRGDIIPGDMVAADHRGVILFGELAKFFTCFLIHFLGLVIGLWLFPPTCFLPF